MSTQENVKKGQRGDSVKSIQTRLNQLGFKLEADGIFGDATDHAVRELQTLFGYTVDGIVGPGTSGLMDAQIGYGWNYTAPDAKQRAMAAQGKAAPAPAAVPAKPAPAAAATAVPAKAAPAAAPAKGNVQQPKKG